jgi:tripartite-type tricarboxylate transporter receptor subunit TctC
VVIDNRAGAGGVIGAAAGGRAEPDGHTILLTTGSVSVHPNMLKNPSYDVRKDLVPVSLIASGPYTFAINPGLPVKTFPEFLAYARANPGKVFYGSAGTGSSTHLIGELFNSMAGTKLVHVPYKGNGPMMTALVGGEIQIGFDTVPGSKVLAEAGKVNLLAVTSETRNASLPQLPPVGESGIPRFEVTLWEAFFLPKGTPEPIVARWNAAIKKVLESPDVQKRLVDFGFDVVGSTPMQLRSRVDADIVKWANVVKSANIATE